MRLGESQDRNRTGSNAGFNAHPKTAFPMIQPQPPQNRPPFRNADVKRSVMTHEHEALAEIHRIDFGVASPRIEKVQNLHCLTVLQVALARTRAALSREQRASQDQPSPQTFVAITTKPAIIVGQAVEVEVVHQPVQAARDTARPVHFLGGRLFGQTVRRAIFRNLEDAARFFFLAPNVGLTHGGYALLQIAHLENFDMGSEKRVMLGEVTVHIKHAGIRMAEEPYPCSAEVPYHQGRLAPSMNFLP